MNLTGLEEKEEYILTPDEEKVAIEGAIEQKKGYLTWKMANLGYTEPQIIQRHKEMNWEEQIDRDAVLATANANKHQALWHQQRREYEKKREKEHLQELRKRCDAKYMLNLMKWTSQNEEGKQLITTGDSVHLIKTLCFFLSNDERFEKELGYSFKKGLLIRGISGLGKTHLVKCVAKNEMYPIQILNMIEISEEVKSEGEYVVSLGENKILYLDDVGTEEATVNHFGTKINWFKNFLEMYYLRNTIYNKLMISTNNSFSEIEEKYGFRVRSRMKDMFNVVDVKGKDLRGS